MHSLIVRLLMHVAVCAVTVTVRGWSEPTAVRLTLTAPSYQQLETQLCDVWAGAIDAAAAAASTDADDSSDSVPFVPAPPLHPSSFTLYYVPAAVREDAPFIDWYRLRHTSKVETDEQLQLYLCSFPTQARRPLLLWQPRAL